MKKILSIIIAAATLLSVCIFTAIPTAAADGEWNVYTSSSYYYDDYEGEPQPIPGYEYTKDGFHTLAPDWTDRTPVIHVQTNEKINIKDGVYMEVRVDAFSYEAGDSWFNFNLWNQLHLSPGSINPKYGTGLQTLIRMHRADSAEETSNLRAVYWHGEEFKGFGGVDIEEEYASPREDGKIYLTFEVKWSQENGYSVNINGAQAPQEFIDRMNEMYGKNDEAYVGIYLHHNEKGGKQEITITKFGTSKDTATTPTGDDSREPLDEDKKEYPMLDPSTVPEGEPAIFITGDKVNSDLFSKPGGHNTNISVNDDFSIHANAVNSGASVSFSVKPEVKYDMTYFPVMIALTRNLCTCDDPTECYALEVAGMYFSAGESVKVDDRFRITELDMCYDPIVIEEGDMKGSYLYFYIDMADEGAPFEATGEFDSARIDFKDIKYQEDGRNEFDVMFFALFRTVEEAEAYVYKYLGVDNSEGVTTESDTETAEDTTEEATADVSYATTEDAVETNTDATEAESASAGETEKENATTAEKGTELVDDNDISAGCSMSFSIGGALVALVATVGGAVTFAKKKED